MAYFSVHYLRTERRYGNDFPKGFMNSQWEEAGRRAMKHASCNQDRTCLKEATRRESRLRKIEKIQ